MIKKENIPYYILLTIAFITSKILYRSADIESINWLLKPINSLFTSFTNSRWVFIPESGYYHEDLNILINKSCSGANFFILTFSMLVIILIHKFERHLSKILFILFSLGISFVFTIFVNTSRIIILTQINALKLDRFHWSHEAVGSFIYLLFLIVLYQIAQYIQTQKFISYERSI